MKFLCIARFAIIAVALPQPQDYPTNDPSQTPTNALDVLCAAATYEGCESSSPSMALATPTTTTSPTSSTASTTSSETMAEPQTTTTTSDPPAETTTDPSLVEEADCPTGHITCETTEGSPQLRDCQSLMRTDVSAIDCGHKFGSGCSTQNDLSQGSCQIDVYAESPLRQ